MSGTHVAEDPYFAFERSLSESERRGIQAWLGAWGESISAFQRTGEGGDEVRAHEASLSRALGQAVVLEGTFYRGVSAGGYRPPEHMTYLRRVIEGPEVIELDCHASATSDEAIGRGFMRADADDEPRDLAVLLIVSARSARALRPFSHAFKDEFEVVLVRGSRYRRTSARRLEDLRAGVESWVVEWQEFNPEGEFDVDLNAGA